MVNYLSLISSEVRFSLLFRVTVFVISSVTCNAAPRNSLWTLLHYQRPCVYFYSLTFLKFSWRDLIFSWFFHILEVLNFQNSHGQYWKPLTTAAGFLVFTQTINPTLKVLSQVKCLILPRETNLEEISRRTGIYAPVTSSCPSER